MDLPSPDPHIYITDVTMARSRTVAFTVAIAIADAEEDCYCEADGVPVELGETSSSVAIHQESLQKPGFPITVDGYYGPETEAQVRAFQAEADLEPTGLLGAATRDALNLVAALGWDEYWTYDEVVGSWEEDSEEVITADDDGTAEDDDTESSSIFGTRALRYYGYPATAAIGMGALERGTVLTFATLGGLGAFVAAGALWRRRRVAA